MITVNKNDIMISRGDTVDKYFYLPGYVVEGGETLTFNIAHVTNKGDISSVVKSVSMTLTTSDGKAYARLQLSATETKAITAGYYCYDILFKKGTTEYRLNYPSKFIVKEVISNV